MLPYYAEPPAEPPAEPSGRAGHFDHVVIESELLRGNPLNDPYRRPLLVYRPPGYDEDRGRRYPVIYVTPGYSGHVGMTFNRTAFRQPYPELIDALFASGSVPPAIVVFADSWTSYGGGQFLNSSATGRYHSYLCDEIVPWIDARYRTLADRDHRALTGKSTGGYVAMVTPMLRPDLFGALATHAGDALFDVGYRTEMTGRARLLRDLYDGSYDRFLKDFRSRVPGTRQGDVELMEVYAYASAYSADEDGTVRVPFDDTGAMIPEIWDRWLAWDPVLMAGRPAYAEALRSLRAVWIDAGNRDEFHLDFGATAFRRALGAAGVPDERIFFELFDGGHGGIEYRYPLALAWLSERISD